jgi:hypothetical protein
MSGFDNPLIMDEKLEDLSSLGSHRKPLQVEICGKSHMELRVDTQFVRFSFTARP